ncbi:hypothetical protein EJ07DRAFT_173987 [Lizonia empirigonia]|nr:hypothetical protein EJ07DRAFT_173987 [Lizonia empirigonia]
MCFHDISGASTPESYPTKPDVDVGTPGTEKSLLFPDVSDASPSNEVGSILVIGDLGYIGSHTAWESYCLGAVEGRKKFFEKLKYFHSNHLPFERKKPTLAFHQIDYRDDERLRKILSLYHGIDSNDSWVRSRISGVIHFAAHKAVAESFQSPLKYYDNNVSGVIQVCETLGEFGIKNLEHSSNPQ